MVLHDIVEGDWVAVVKIGANAGFVFTGDELKQAVPLGFFKGGGAMPDAGWDVATFAAPTVEVPSE